MKSEKEFWNHLVRIGLVVFVLIYTGMEAFGTSNIKATLIIFGPFILMYILMTYFIAIRRVSWVKVYLMTIGIFILIIVIGCVIGIILMLLGVDVFKYLSEFSSWLLE